MIKMGTAYQCLDAAIVIGNAFHVSWILPVGDAIIVQRASTQDQSCMRTGDRGTASLPLEFSELHQG